MNKQNKINELNQIIIDIYVLAGFLGYRWSTAISLRPLIYLEFFKNISERSQ